MLIKGNAHVYGDNINTDLIIAGKYTKTMNMQDLAAHCMEDIDPNFHMRVCCGDVMVGGTNFGCGSSREHAPLAIKHSGISMIVAKSYSRLFFRNAINLGIPAIICDTNNIKNGDSIKLDPNTGRIIINDSIERICQGLPKIMQDILEKGGLVAYLQEYGDFI